jgi:preprotein translocase subunit SecD
MPSPSRSGPRPGRALAALGVIVLIMLISITGSDTFSPGKWHHDFRVGLGLDLSSGTQVTLKATTFSGGTPTQAEMDTAQTIMLNRVNGTGNSGAEVEPEGTDLITVSVPNANSSQVIQLVSTTADLWFRPVLLAAPYTGSSSTAKATPKATPSASASPKASTSASAKASATSTAKTTAKITHDDATASPSATATPKASASATASASPTASATPSTSTSDYYGNQSEVDKSVLKVFEKMSCTPSSSSTTVNDGWKSQIGYTYEQWDNKTAQVVSCDSSGTKYVLGPAVVAGEQITSASAQLASTGSEWVVAISLNGAASSAWGTLTTKQYSYYQDYESQQNYDDYYLSSNAVVLDGNVITAAATEAALTDGSFQIQGSFTESYATFLANVIKYGSVPLKFTVVDSESVSPQIGRQSLDAGLLAALIGFILVIAYCVFYYRGLAIVSICSLLTAALLAYLAIVLLTKYQQGFGLQLSGIAGLIVAVGITADSFVVFFERLRDEVREGKSLRPAVESGWRRARRTILVSDTVSFLAALVLYELAIGDVRGFAYTLGLTTLIDVLVVFLFTKPMVTLLAATKFFGGGHKWSGLSPDRLGARTPWRSSIRRQPAGRASRSTSSREA